MALPTLPADSSTAQQHLTSMDSPYYAGMHCLQWHFLSPIAHNSGYSLHIDKISAVMP